MAALGGLLGAYGSDDDEVMSDQEHEETQKTGQVTLLGVDDDAGILSHLTGGAAALANAQADTAGGAAPQGAAPASHPGLAGADQAGAMEEDGAAPTPAAGGAEQPPAAGDGAQQDEPADPLARLPPEMRQPPDGKGYPDIQARIEHWLHLQRTRGRKINEEIRKSRGYRNPEFFAKMVEHLEIEQYGTSFAPEVFDPKALPAEDYLDALQREWAAEDERRRASRAAGQGRVEFHKSASNPSLVQPALKPGLQPGSTQATGQSIAAAAAQAAARAAAAAAADKQQQQAAANQAVLGAAAAQNQAAVLAAQATAAAQARAAQFAAQAAQRR